MPCRDRRHDVGFAKSDGPFENGLEFIIFSGMWTVEDAGPYNQFKWTVEDAGPYRVIFDFKQTALRTANVLKSKFNKNS